MFRKLNCIFVLYSFAACLQAAEILPPQLHQYEIHVAEDLSRLDITACFDKAVPEFLVAGSSAAAKHLDYMNISVKGNTRSLTPQRRRVNIPRVPDDQCLRYGVIIKDIVKTQQLNVMRQLNVGLRTDDSIMLALDYWLWRPSKLDDTTDIELRFHLPAGMTVSAPWQERETESGLPVFALAKHLIFGLVASWLGKFIEQR